MTMRAGRYKRIEHMVWTDAKILELRRHWRTCPKIEYICEAMGLTEGKVMRGIRKFIKGQL